MEPGLLISIDNDLLIHGNHVKDCHPSLEIVEGCTCWRTKNTQVTHL